MTLGPPVQVRSSQTRCLTFIDREFDLLAKRRIFFNKMFATSQLIPLSYSGVGNLPMRFLAVEPSLETLEHPRLAICCHISSKLFFFNFSLVLTTHLEEHLLPGASWHGGRLPCRRSVRATRHGLARQQHGQHGVAWHVRVRRRQQLARQRLAEELCGRADLLLHAEPATVWGDFHDSLRTSPRPLRPVPRP